ncbi:cytochrome P450 6B5 [Manduca sexta]|uniref:cytochrome P450 6B5 n=1 Tax=Manduca sexta TaxID=7130 RepID=UPI0018905663|nr:cytochrome P450 6B5 [Manduca sexta]
MLLQVLMFLCFIFTLIYILKKRNYWRSRGITEVEGSLWKFTFGDRSLPEYYKEIYDKYDDEQIGVYLGSIPSLMLKNLDDIQAVMAGDFQSFYKRGLTVNKSDILGDNILFIDEYPRWKLLRTKLTPVFTSIRLKTMFLSIEKCAKDFVDLIESDETLMKKPFDMLYTFTAASIGAAVFGIDIGGKKAMESPFVIMAWKALTPSFSTNLKFLTSNAFPWLYKTLQLRFFSEHEEFFIGAVKSVFEARRKAEKRNDFIDLCLELQKNGTMKDSTTEYELEPTDEVLAAQAFFFFIAGADTTANALHFSLLELAGHPTILAKLHNNIDEVFKDGKTAISYEDMDKLQYLDMVVNEAMRKYPPVGQLQRICTRNTELPSNKLKIEKDTGVVIPIYAIHRDEKLFPNPEVFDPERFSPENVQKMHNYSFMAFGGGNRICIGMRFARLQLKACLAWLLRKYTLEEKVYRPERFERSSFSLRDTNATYKLIRRNNN